MQGIDEYVPKTMKTHGPYTPKSEEPFCLPHPGHPYTCTKNQLLLDTAGLTVTVAANPHAGMEKPALHDVSAGFPIP